MAINDFAAVAAAAGIAGSGLNGRTDVSAVGEEENPTRNSIAGKKLFSSRRVRNSAACNSAARNSPLCPAAFRRHRCARVLFIGIFFAAQQRNREQFHSVSLDSRGIAARLIMLG